MNRFLYVALHFLIMAGIANSWADGGDNMILVQGHRGARGALPENTLAAFAYAIEAGADILELDLAVTQDKAVVVTHDPFLNPEICLLKNSKKITKQIPVYSLTLAELREIDCGSLPNPKFPKQKTSPGEKIPLLAELFELTVKSKHPNAKTVQFNIEIKSVPAGYGIIYPQPKEYARLALDVVKKYKMEKRVIIQSFDHAVLREVMKLNKRLRFSALFADNYVDYVLMAKKLGVQYISPDMYWITKQDVQNLHKAKIKLCPWTVNEPKDWERMVELGVDSIITDYPAELLQYLRERKLHK